MNIKQEFNNIVHAKWFPWALGGVAGLLVLYYFYSRSGSSAASSSTDTSGGTDYAAAEAAYAQQQTANAQIASQAQAESDQYSLQMATLNAQQQAASDANTTAAISAVGDTLGQIITAQEALPVATINAATADHQSALQNAAIVAATADQAIPGTLSGAASVLGASYEPLDIYGAGISQSGSVLAANSIGSNFNSAEQASASVATSAQNASTQRAVSSNNTQSSEMELGTIAALAFL